jgi:YesN/AraC family two-component response regulator
MRKLEMSLPYYREQLKSELLQVPAAPGDALQEKLAELSIPIGMHHLALLLVTFEERTGTAAPNGRRSSGHGDNGVGGGRMEVPWAKIRLLDELKQGTLLRGPYMTVDTGQRQLAIVVHAEATAMNEVFQLGEQMIERMEQLAEETVSIGVGRYCASIAELPRAYEEASEALRFRLLHGRGQVIYIEDVVLEQEDAAGAVFPKEREELFAGYVKLGNAEQAKRIVRDLIASCAAQKHRIHYAELQFVLFKIITIVLQTLQHLGADINRLVRVDSNPFRDVMALESMEQLQVWFDGFLQNAADGVGAGKQRKDNHHVARVIEILEQDHAKDLSLNSVSEMLDLNPSYVSRLFKQYTGVSFTEYLTDIRISRSKELLRTTRLQVSEVGSQVGFHNAYYFIKVFKENVGVTPGEFKKIFGVGDADDRLHNDDIANL